jgi:hypothetical protein
VRVLYSIWIWVACSLMQLSVTTASGRRQLRELSEELNGGTRSSKRSTREVSHATQAIADCYSGENEHREQRLGTVLNAELPAFSHYDSRQQHADSFCNDG